jgi:hypothetical protein
VLFIPFILPCTSTLFTKDSKRSPAIPPVFIWPFIFTFTSIFSRLVPVAEPTTPPDFWLFALIDICDVSPVLMSSMLIEYLYGSSSVPVPVLWPSAEPITPPVF